MANPAAVRAVLEKQTQMQPDPGLMGWTMPAGMTPAATAGGGYSGWVSGRPVGPSLPRPWETFLSGAFGPFLPILPMPLDIPAEGGEGRPAPRRFEYPVGWNLPIGQPGSEGMTLAAFATLRELARRYSTVWGMVNLRVKELAGLDWDVGPTKDAQQAAKKDKALAQDQTSRAKQVVDWFKWSIDPNYTDGFQSWFTAALWDQFVLDAVAVHPLPTRVPGKGLFNRGIAHWELLDAATVRPLLDTRGALPQPPAVAYQQYLWGIPRVDMLSILAIGDADEAEAMLDAAGLASDLDELEPDGQFRMDQLHYWKQTPWTNNVYGLSPVAAALLPIAIGLQRQIWFNDYYSEGTIPGVFVIAGQAYQTATQQQQLQNSLNAMAGDVAWKHRIIVLPPGSDAKPQKDMAFGKDVDLAIMEYLYPVLQIQPQEIGQMPGGRTSGMAATGAAQQMMDSVSRQRTQPDRKVWKHRFDRFIQQALGQEDLEWKWVDFEEEEDEEKKAAAEASDLSNGLRTIDSIRVDNGEDAFGFPLTSTPFLKLGAGIIPLDPDVKVPPAIPPQGEPPKPGGGAPPAEGAGPPEKPQEPSESPSGSAAPPEGGPAASAAPTPSSEAPAEEEPTGKLTLADVVKWRIRYKGKKLPSTVHGYLLRSYPEDEVKWAADERIDWSAEPHVKLAGINWRRRPGGRDYEKEQSIADSLARGATMDPVVLCEFASKGVYNRAGLTVADGYHRTGGADKAGWADVPAFVGRNVPDEYRDRIRGSMQDESASVADQKKAQQAELAVLRRYLKAGRDAASFVPAALTTEQVRRVAERTAEVGMVAAFEEARKDVSLASPLATGLAPFDLEGAAPNAEAPHPTRCTRCGAPLLGSPDVPISERAVGLCGDCQVDDATKAVHKAGDPQALIDWYNAGADGQIDWGSDGDFDQCVDVASQYMAEIDAKGFCNLRHQDAVGGPPGSEGKALLAGHGTSEVQEQPLPISQSPYFPKYSDDQPRVRDLLDAIDEELARRAG